MKRRGIEAVPLMVEEILQKESPWKEVWKNKWERKNHGGIWIRSLEEMFVNSTRIKKKHLQKFISKEKYNWTLQQNKKWHDFCTPLFFWERGLLDAGAEEIDFADVSSQVSLPPNVNPGDASKC